jgi:hypothetical protein
MAVVAAIAAAGCGDDSRQPPQGTGVGVGLTAGPPVKLFTCQDWNDSDPQTRFSTVARIRDYTGGPVTGRGTNGQGTVLDDEQAYEFFDQYCDQRLASHFLLYRLYSRAAGFVGQAPDN